MSGPARFGMSQHDAWIELVIAFNSAAALYHLRRGNNAIGTHFVLMNTDLIRYQRRPDVAETLDARRLARARAA